MNTKEQQMRRINDLITENGYRQSLQNAKEIIERWIAPEHTINAMLDLIELELSPKCSSGSSWAYIDGVIDNAHRREALEFQNLLKQKEDQIDDIRKASMLQLNDVAGLLEIISCEFGVEEFRVPYGEPCITTEAIEKALDIVELEPWEVSTVNSHWEDIPFWQEVNGYLSTMHDQPGHIREMFKVDKGTWWVDVSAMDPPDYIKSPQFDMADESFDCIEDAFSAFRKRCEDHEPMSRKDWDLMEGDRKYDEKKEGESK